MSEEEAQRLEGVAEDCRTVAAGTNDKRTRAALLDMAKDMDKRAARMREALRKNP